jgi:hypothetical protein
MGDDGNLFDPNKPKTDEQNKEYRYNNKEDLKKSIQEREKKLQEDQKKLDDDKKKLKDTTSTITFNQPPVTDKITSETKTTAYSSTFAFTTLLN